MKSTQTFIRTALLTGSAALLPIAGAVATQSMAPGRQVAESGPGAPATGIRPQGDTEISIDMSKIKSPELPKIFNYIDAHIDEHVRNLQKWIQQPSVSNTGEGIQESAQMVKGYFDQLGCQLTKVYDPGITEWGQQSNPVVYAKCDEGAKRTIVIYWQYDTMPVTQPDLWIRPPFAGDLVEQAPYKKVLIGRGATNSKGPEMSQWNALMSIKAVTGKLPVNIIFVAEGDEERMDVGLRTFVKAHADLFKGAEALYGPGPSEGCLFIELTTSGKSWGRGPVYSDIHGANKRSVDSPAWRHIKMLSTLVADNGNKVLIPGFYDNIVPLTAAEQASLQEAAKKMKPEEAAKNLGVARFIADKPIDIVTMQRHGTSFNLDGIWSGNMFPGGSGAILPNTITSKHNIRYVPNMTGPDIVKKLRAYLDKEGYQDVQIHVVGDVPWAKQRHDTEIAKASDRMFDAFGAERRSPPVENQASIMGGYWPAYLFSGDPINLPIAGGAAGSGGGAHAANEFYVIEGAKKTYGMAGAEKSVATVLYNYAGLN
ncbi:MAG TPA: M20/M25/M40 family metallo-hydrolase [Steroidobacteraceae bacterium]|nr:M20/M25/M40 family metallo-hydrolase [Steroidobacteraceae bacterium]